MNGLEPERYYSILIKSEYDNIVNIIDDKLYFKVINGWAKEQYHLNH